MYLGIDVNYLCWRGYYASGNMSYNGEGTGAIHSFLTALLYHSKQFGISTPIFAFDSRKSLRKRVFPGYKDRTSKLTEAEKEERAEVGRQINKVRRIVIPTMGFNNVFIQTGLEGDDILGRLVRDNPHKLVVITSDEDLWQLVDECTWHSPNTKVTHNVKSFRKKYGIAPRDWRIVKQIAGCSSDTVPGIHMVGNATAVKYLNGTLGKSTIAYQVIEYEARGMRRKNGILVNLPHPKTKSMVIEEDNFTIDGFLAICDLYGFDRLAKRAGDFEMMFK